MKLLSSTALVVGFGLLQANKLSRSSEDRSIAEEKVQLLLSITEQQEQLASLQTQAEISNNVSSLATLNAHTSEIVQSWCDASLATEKDRLPRLGKLIDSKAPDLEREAARDARAAELSYSRLVASACKLQQQEIGHGLGQDLAAIQLRTDASVKETLRKPTAATQKTAAKADSEDDKAFQSYMASMNSASEAKHEEDEKEETSEKEVQTENAKGDEAEADEEEEDDAAKKPAPSHATEPAPSHATEAATEDETAKKPTKETAKKLTKAVVAASKDEKAAEAKVQAKDDEDDDDDDDEEEETEGAKKATAGKSKVPASFLQLTNRHRLKQMSLNQMLEFLIKQPSTKQAKKWCRIFETNGNKKTSVAPLKNARKSLKAEQAKLEDLKVLQLAQKKESKFRARFDKFWKADTKALSSLLQELDNSKMVWEANTYALHSASDRKAVEAARERFGKTSSALETALASRQQSIKDQEKKMHDLEAAIAGMGDRREKQLLAIKKAETKLEKVQNQISNIMSACAEMKREGGKLLMKGIPVL